jgi:hypothetical protein
VEVPSPAGSASAGAAGWTFLKAFLVLVASFFSAMFVAVSSLFITSGIVLALSRPDPDSGEPLLPPPPVTFTILALVILTEVAALTLIIRKLRASNRTAAAAAATPAPGSDPSAPSYSPPCPYATTGTAGSGNGNGGVHVSVTAAPIPGSSTTTTSTTTTTTRTAPASEAGAAAGMPYVYNSLRRTLNGLTSSLSGGASAADPAAGGYYALPAGRIGLDIDID